MRTAVVMGKGTLAVKVAEWFRSSPDYKLRGVVPVYPEPEWTDSLEDWATRSNVRVINRHRRVPNMEPDLVFSVFYDKILRQKFIDGCGLVLNLRNAPLPRYRGCRPINWALRNGEHTHGVTIHEVTAGIDAGPIYNLVNFPIDPATDEVRDVYERCLTHGWMLFLQTICGIWTTTPEPQNEAHATYYTAEMGEHLWERSGWTREESIAECERKRTQLESDYADESARGANDGKA